MAEIRVGVLASGSGTNLQAIIDAAEKGEIPAQVAVVISNVKDAYALTRARNHGIPAFFVDLKSSPSRESYDHHLISLLREREVELIVLAGYMLMVGPEFVQAFPNRIMNIHPALLPSFPGTHAVSDALEYGAKVSGVTVHFVDEGLDTGAIILQEAVPVHDGDTEEALHQRIHQVEYQLYPLAIKLFAQGKLQMERRRVRIAE
jgi:phosphoribosylglycinamide formyltransferase-1